MKVPFIKDLMLCLLLLAVAGTSMAQDRANGIVRTPQPATELEVPLYKSRILSLPTSISRISVGSPDIADLLLLRSTELYVLGKDLGSTNVLLWDANDVLVAVVSVEVSHDLESLKKKLYDLMPNEPIEVRSAQRSIVLSGTVSSPVNVSAAVDIAEGYLAQIGTAIETEMFEQRQQGSGRNNGAVINLLQVGGAQQVMLEVKVAEIARTELRKIDMRFNAVSRSDRWTTGGVNGGGELVSGDVDTDVESWFSPNDLFIQDKGLFASLLTNDFLLNLTLEAAKENNLAKILAEPNLTTLSGQEARFLSGGEFAIPVRQEDGANTIEFKEFGVAVGFLPVVLGDGRINMVLNISVSELVNATTAILSEGGALLSKRSANATVELKDGQTIGIAGLIDENMREGISKFPGLGDIPILGHLFRSQQFIKNETELVILVTPHLARPIAPEDIRLPTDNFVEPNDVDFYLLGRMEGAGSGEKGAGGTTTNFGHDLD